MEKNQNKKAIEATRNVADKIDQVSEEQRNDSEEKGIAITHEQVSNGYMDGTIDQKIDKTGRKGS